MALGSPLFFFRLHFPAFYFMPCSSGVSARLSDASSVQALRARGWARPLSTAAVPSAVRQDRISGSPRRGTGPSTSEIGLALLAGGPT